MNIEFKFDLLQDVRMKPLGGGGRVVQCRVLGQGNEYNVRYFDQGKELTSWFFEDELEAFK